MPGGGRLARPSSAGKAFVRRADELWPGLGLGRNSSGKSSGFVVHGKAWTDQPGRRKVKVKVDGCVQQQVQLQCLAGRNQAKPSDLRSHALWSVDFPAGVGSRRRSEPTVKKAGLLRSHTPAALHSACTAQLSRTRLSIPPLLGSEVAGSCSSSAQLSAWRCSQQQQRSPHTTRRPLDAASLVAFYLAALLPRSLSPSPTIFLQHPRSIHPPASFFALPSARLRLLRPLVTSHRRPVLLSSLSLTAGPNPACRRKKSAVSTGRRP